MALIRVLQVLTILNRGGAESMIMNYYRKLDKNKIQFDFLVHRKEKAAFEDEIENLGGKVFKLSPINPFFPENYYKELRSFFTKNNEYTIVHSHLNAFSSFPLKIAKEFSIPCRIAHAHIAIDKIGVKSFFVNKESKKEILKKIVKLYLKNRVVSEASHFFSCGVKAGEWLFGNDIDFQLMNNAINVDEFVYNASVKSKYKEEFDLGKNIVLGHVGRFTSQKNHEYILQIFNKLLKVEKTKNITLMLIGDGPLKEKIENLAISLGIKNQVLFLGVRTDIAQLLQMVDVFLFPSFYEGLPVTLIEAQASGTKVLASNSISKEVCITNDINLLPIDNNSIDLWVKEIIKLKPFNNKSNNRKAIIKGGYDIDSNTKKIEKFYLNQSTVN